MTPTNTSTVGAAPDPQDSRIAALMNEGQPFVALALATRALKDHGESYDGLAALARIETFLGFYKRAQLSWRRALRVRPLAEAHAGLGTALFRDGQTAAGIDAFRAGLKLDPDNLSLLSSLAVACLYLDDFARARRYAARALQIDPACHDALLCRARADFALGHVHLAEADIETLRHAGYKTHETLLLQIGIQSRIGQHEAAVLLAAELCEAYPGSAECLKAFRQAFAAFQAKADGTDLAAFLDGLEIPWVAPAAPLPKAPPPGDGVRIDVIVPVHNALPQVEACLATVLANSGPRLGRLILVDDASKSETAAALALLVQGNPGTILVQTPQRSGFTGAVLCGLPHSDAPAFVVLNSDTLVPNGWLDSLYAGLTSHAAMAMVGPMSNNAAWQSYGPVFDAEFRFCTAAIPEPAARDQITARAPAMRAGGLVSLPILHGFCLMIDRAAYEAVGGFDATAYPQGYGETQDLSLRLLRAGHLLAVVSDCIVFHERGASISDRRRETLSQAARERLYESYTALNYLCLEMVCCGNAALRAAAAVHAAVAGNGAWAPAGFRAWPKPQALFTCAASCASKQHHSGKGDFHERRD